MYRDNYIHALRTEIVEMVEEHLTPAAIKYGYSQTPLETNIKWRPMVLVIGNYSSGKSSLINEFLGAEIQDTGQAPTDDSFTVLTYDDSVSEKQGIQVIEQRDGKALLNDPEYPFSNLRKHGQRFSSHFQLKKINSPFLKDLAIIDTPGMLDSITERDRGYNYQEVIGDLAQKAGLVLVLFDAHKAGTVREAYKSIRETLTANTFEDRIIFVLNRIDECSSFNDLLRVYGTLCWNLSQITGRKDIPMIRMTYSSSIKSAVRKINDNTDYLPLLENQREDLRQAILQTPMRRLDHLASYVEVHGERLCHYIESILAYRQKSGKYRMQKLFTGFLSGMLGGSLAAFLLMLLAGGMDLTILLSVAGGVGTLIFILWTISIQPRLELKYHNILAEDIDSLTTVDDQTRKDSWAAIRDLVNSHVLKNKKHFSVYELKKDLFEVRSAYNEDSKEIREALSELSIMSDQDFEQWEKDRLAHEEYQKEKQEMSSAEIMRNSLKHMY
ncbi:Dynamin domain-containing protein [Desulfonema limicola]|uniref:Dynamin domain-containing protein n=1 Tax=Desulfonema limicola TaxID=45656 RepID=A0A975B7W3_9BACT|nr:dynamin family protein [Desulfonema limicola]QTA80515.1 Dynamin domain-containing protein [Desulfonema limicola]